MALPHPKSRKGNYGKGDIPNDGGVIWKFFKRTINISDYRNGEDEVNPAINRTFGGILHDWFVIYSADVETEELKPSFKRSSEAFGTVCSIGHSSSYADIKPKGRSFVFPARPLNSIRLFCTLNPEWAER